MVCFVYASSEIQLLRPVCRTTESRFGTYREVPVAPALVFDLRTLLSPECNYSCLVDV